MPRFSKKSTAGKHESSRRVSASTTAPSAPPASSSHMNQNRSWPGVPNRYSTSSELIVMRPKSSATVVVVLRSTPVRSSIPDPASVSSSSVRSGGISLTVPTMVVLPTPNPPAIRILSADWPRRRSEIADAIENRLEDSAIGLRGLAARWRAEQQLTALDQVAQQHLHHHHRQVDRGRDLGDRHRSLAGGEDPGVLGLA